MKTTYIILRSLEGPLPKYLQNGNSQSEKQDIPVYNDLIIDKDEITPLQLKAIKKEPSVISLAPLMPMMLHKPVKIESYQNPTDTTAWGIEIINVNKSKFSGRNIIIAVLDTGIDSRHSAFEGIDILEEDFTGEGNGDNDGHGTHCSGIIFGRDVNGVRIGIAQNIKKALIGKVLGRNGGSTESIIKAIHWAINEGANIISMSLGIDFPGYVKHLIEDRNFSTLAATSTALEAYRANLDIYRTVAQFAIQHGINYNPKIIIAASGNESNRPNWTVAVSPPAAENNFISVGAVGKNTLNELYIAKFSNTMVSIVAPGVSIPSAKRGGGLIEMSGTSMAAPHVAGIAALWGEKLKKENRFSQNTLHASVIANATEKIFQTDFNQVDMGVGLIQAP